MPKGTKTDGKKKIIWSADEIRRLVEAGKKARKDTGITIPEAIKRVQDQVLEPHRRRVISGMQTLPKILATLMEQMGPEMVPVTELQAIQTAKAEVEKQLDAERNARDDLKQQLEVSQAANEALRSQPSAIDQISMFLSGVVASGIKESGLVDVIDSLTTAFAGVPRGPAQINGTARHNPLPVHSGPAKPVSVLCVGPEETDTQRIRLKLRDHVKVRCFNKGRLNTLAQLAKNSDMVFISTDLAGQVAFQTVKEVTTKFQRVPGGMPNLIDEVASWTDRTAAM